MPAILTIWHLPSQFHCSIQETIENLIGGIGIGKIGDLVLPVAHAIVEARLPLLYMLIEQVQEVANSLYQRLTQRKRSGAPLDHDQDIILPYIFAYYWERLNTKIAGKLKRRICIKKCIERPILDQPTNQGRADLGLITWKIYHLVSIFSLQGNH